MDRVRSRGKPQGFNAEAKGAVVKSITNGIPRNKQADVYLRKYTYLDVQHYKDIRREQRVGSGYYSEVLIASKKEVYV